MPLPPGALPAAWSAEPSGHRSVARSLVESGWSGTGLPAGPLQRRPDALRLVLFGILLMTIGRVHQHFSFLEPLRPALAMMALACLLVFWRPELITPVVLRRSWSSWMVIALAAIACLVAPFGISLGASASFLVSDFSKVFLLWLLLVLAIRSVRDLSILVWGYVVGAGFLCWFSIFVYGSSNVGSQAVRLSGNLYMYDPNDICVILIIALPMALHILQVRSGFQRWLATAIVLASGATIALSGSRGGFLGLGALVLVLLTFVNQISLGKRVGFALALLVALVVAAPEGYWDQMRTILEPTEDYNWDSEDGRLEIWRRGLGYMLGAPLTGVGIDNFGRAEGTISEKARYHIPGTGLRFTAPHNSIVQVGAELGIPGLIIWLSLSLGNIVGLARLRRRIPAHWAQGSQDERYLHGLTLYLPISFFGFLVTASFVSFAYLDPLYILTAFAGGLYVLIEWRLEREQDQYGPLYLPGAEVVGGEV